MRKSGFGNGATMRVGKARGQSKLGAAPNWSGAVVAAGAGNCNWAGRIHRPAGHHGVVANKPPSAELSKHDSTRQNAEAHGDLAGGARHTRSRASPNWPGKFWGKGMEPGRSGGGSSMPPQKPHGARRFYPGTNDRPGAPTLRRHGRNLRRIRPPVPFFTHSDRGPVARPDPWRFGCIAGRGAASNARMPGG